MATKKQTVTVADAPELTIIDFSGLEIHAGVMSIPGLSDAVGKAIADKKVVAIVAMTVDDVKIDQAVPMISTGLINISAPASPFWDTVTIKPAPGDADNFVINIF